MLENNFPDIEVVGECASVSESVARLKERPDEADLIFMDVELSDGECFEIFRQVAVKPRVVMTTAYDSYAVKAFEAGSIDYLLKPIDMSALKREPWKDVDSFPPESWMSRRFSARSRGRIPDTGSRSVFWCSSTTGSCP